jgi:AcrR family transcriptional regulator
MARPPLSDAEIAAFRKKAIRVATRLFARNGYAAVTLRAIAEGLGTSHMAPYRYFENKAEIFAMVRADAFRRFSDVQERAFVSTEEPLERLFSMRAAYVRFALDHPDEYRVMFDLGQEPEETYPKLAEESHRAFLALEKAVTLAIGARVLAGEPRTVAHLLWASIHGMVSLHLAGKLTLGATLDDLLAAPPLQIVTG